MRQFVRAVNSGNFDEQYALFVSNENYSNVPLIPKRTFAALIKNHQPPFPSNLKIGENPVEVGEFDSDMSGFTVPVLNKGTGVTPTGNYAQYFGIAMQKSDGGWKVRGFFTYWDYYNRTYGDEAAEKFKADYMKEAARLGLTTTQKTPEPTE